MCFKCGKACCPAPLPRTQGIGAREKYSALPWKSSTTFTTFGSMTSAAAAMGMARVATSTVASFIRDRKSTRLNSSHGYISYAVFCLKKKNKQLKSRHCHLQNTSLPLQDTNRFSSSPQRAQVSRVPETVMKSIQAILLKHSTRALIHP